MKKYIVCFFMAGIAVVILYCTFFLNKDVQAVSVVRQPVEVKDTLLYSLSENMQKMSAFMRLDENQYPIITIDSVTAVDSLNVDPHCYTWIKEGWLWKKNILREIFFC